MILMIVMILQVNDWRYWNQNEMLIHKTDLAKIPPAAVIFQEAEETMLAPGMVVSDTAASVPLASLLRHSVTRLASTEVVSKKLVHGEVYELLVKSGTDGQSGRGNYCWKPKPGEIAEPEEEEDEEEDEEEEEQEEEAAGGRRRRRNKKKKKGRKGKKKAKKKAKKNGRPNDDKM